MKTMTWLFRWLFLMLLVSASLAFSQTSITISSTFARPENHLTPPPPGTPTFNVIVQLDAANATGHDIYYTFSTSDGTATTADNDYTARTNFQVRIPVGATIRHAIIPVINDDKYELNETFTVTILSAWIDVDDDGNNTAQDTPLTITNATSTVIIQNDDPLPTVRIRSDEANEGDSPENDIPSNNFARFRIVLSNPAYLNARVDLMTTDGTARVADNDYMPRSGYATIDAGNVSLPANVPYIADNKVEDDEHFFMDISNARLSDGTVLTITDARGRGRILNDDFSADIEVAAKWVREADGGPKLTTVTASEEYRFVIQLINRGDADAKDVVVEDVLPSWLIFQSADHDYTFDGTTVRWTVHSLLRNEEKRVRVYARINPNTPEGTVITNRGCKVGGDIPDPNTQNNCSTVSVTVLQPDKDAFANINSDLNVGLPPLWITFESLKPLAAYKWYLDLDKRSRWDKPSYIYRHVIPPAGAGKKYDIGLVGPIVTEEATDFIRVYEPGGLGHLRFLNGTRTTSLGIWENAVDGDLYWHDGTAEVAADETGAAWAIFEFTDQSSRKINQVRLMTDTGLNNLKKQATDFQVLASTDGITFTEVLTAQKTNNVYTPTDIHDDWMSWTFAPVDAKFIKLVVTKPLNWTYAAIGEFEVWFETKLADPDSSSLAVNGETVTMTVRDQEGHAITGLTSHDIVVYSFNCDEYWGDPRVVFGTGLAEDSANPGVYTCSIVNKGYVEASINGVIIPKPINPALAAAAQLALPTGEDVAVEAVATLPKAYALEHNFPNPFNPETTIRYQLPEASTVVLRVYDMRGSQVDELVNTYQSAGSYSVIWRAHQHASGIYFYHLTAGSFKAIRSMSLVK